MHTTMKMQASLGFAKVFSANVSKSLFRQNFYRLSFVLYGIHLIVDVINEYVLPTVVQLRSILPRVHNREESI